MRGKDYFYIGLGIVECGIAIWKGSAFVGILGGLTIGLACMCAAIDWALAGMREMQAEIDRLEKKHA